MNTRKLTHCGIMIDLLAPSPEDIVLRDIAHALARCVRFTGHGDNVYTVAQHCVVVAELARLAGESRAVQAWALLHDAEEAYTNDVPSPMKAAVRELCSIRGVPSVFDIIAKQLQWAVSTRFGIPIVDVKRYDDAASLLEVECNGPHSCAAHSWPEYRGPRPTALPGGVWGTELAEFLWLQRAAELGIK
jgi:hypothetical protein